ncbi:GNAT family N-acetyltransferase [Parahaliea aestuarii]|uniref:GNAT family N-acetyltransferase n=1 Tax=Parahaliea aestuarii TaxID=1852021 RepID=A0A5C8ZMR2_9GAMM|nr:GNAT family protein [Parahaliea aestuarii]TXS89748.1 GNAT family N-acetyltransferase [Parahaliea aestuarii]
MSRWHTPVTLHGERVRLEPLSPEHAQGLYRQGRSEADWAYMPRGPFVDLADTRHWIDEAVTGSAYLPFAIVDTGSGRVAGSTRYLNIRPEHRGLEIGWTWLGADWQRTGVNTEAKLLLLEYAFEQLGCIRVEFKTDERNLRSQRALERIGAVREGVLRQHMVVQQGYLRNSVYFSVLDSEWPATRQHLLALRDRASGA